MENVKFIYINYSIVVMENKRKNIIFCDDQPFIGHSLKAHLMKYVNIDLAHRLGDLIDKLQNKNYHYDLVVCDRNLPDGKDLEIIDAIKKVYQGKIYIISICRCDDDNLKEQLFKKGVNEVLFRGIGEEVGYLEDKIIKLQ